MNQEMLNGLYIEWLRVRSERFAYDLELLNQSPADDRFSLIQAAINRHRETENVSSMNLCSIPYEEFLQTDYWLYLRQALIRLRGRKCERCRTSERVLDVHHKTYEHRGVEVFYPSDLEILCRECHQNEHHINVGVTS